nr:TrbI/VirB10 family protein [Dyella sp. ASV24]
MNQNNSNQPGDASEQEYSASHDAQAAASGNPYAARHQAAATPDLDAAAPQLRSSDMRRMNLRALGFLGGIVALLLVAAVWMFNSATNRNNTPQKAKEETVTVPDAPKAQALPPPPVPVPRLPQPIPVAPTLPTPQPERFVRQEPRGSSLVERRMMATDAAIAAGSGSGGYPNAGQGQQMQQGMPGYGGIGQMMGGLPGMPGTGVPINTAYSAKPLPEVSTAQPLVDPDTLMLRGTFIRCVLETRIITDIPGFTSCVVTEPVYSFNGKHLLLPKGSKVLGKYEMEPNGPRVAVIWDRIVTPTGIDVNMASPGVDNLGGAGHPGYYNAHWGSRIGAALLISMLSDAFKYEAAEHGPKTTTVSNGVVTQSPYESNTAQTMQMLANQAVQRAANRPATVTINQGTVLTIYVAKDVDFSGVVARF